MKHPLTIGFFLLPFLSLAQVFSFYPGPELEGQIDPDGYGVHQIDILNETEDSLWLTWRLIENTLPSEWEVNLCDNVLCYGAMPTSANMNPIASGDSAFIRLTTFPNNVSGSGIMRFWIYPTGQPDQHEVITFFLSAGVSSADDRPELLFRVFPNPAWGPVRIELAQPGAAWSLMDATGRVRQQGKEEGAVFFLDLSPLSPGPFWLQVRQGNRLYCRPLICIPE